MPIDMLNERYRDGGPYYAETRVDPNNWIIEPWNAASALLFLGLVIYWMLRLRGRYRQHPFLCCCLPLLAAGGAGGTLYHALRISPVFLVLDWLPIVLLVLAASLYLWLRLVPRWWYVVPMPLLLLAIPVSTQGFPTQVRISIGYAVMAGLILTPALLVLWRTRFRHAGWIGLALGCFVVALFFRLADVRQPPLLPMGTHWLWHSFGAFATLALAEYIFRLEMEPVRH
jgi:hypothetical protein